MARERSSPYPALAASIALHASVLIAGLIAWPWLNPPAKLPQVVPVTLVTADDQASMRSAEAAPTPTPAATETPTPEAAPQAPAPEPSPTPVKAPAPAPAPPKPAPSKPTPKPPPAKAQPTKPDKTLDLDALAASLSAPNKSAGAKQSSAMRGPNRAQTALKTQTSAGSGSVVANGAVASMAAELQRLWNPDCEVAGGDIVITITYRLQPNGRLLGAPTSSAENSTDPVVKAASDRAKRAVYAAAPFEDLPAAYYNGQSINVPFNAKQACAQR